MKKKRVWKPYRTYSFKDKDPILAKITAAIEDSSETKSAINKESGVSKTTLSNWQKPLKDGGTRCPQFATLNAVARALGYDLQLVQVARKATSRRARSVLASTHQSLAV